MNAQVRSCIRKKKYFSQVDALLRAAEKTGITLRSYRCPVCRMWHLTSQK